jgi:TRAP-type C4-dicarboxylate transport system permease small subunit
MSELPKSPSVPGADELENVHLIVATDEEVKIEYFPEDWIAIAVFWGLAIIVFLQFFTRYIMNNSLSWTEEIARYMLMVLVFVGGAIVTRRRTQIAVELVSNVMKDGIAKRALLAFVGIASLGFLAILAWLSVLITDRMHNLYMTVFDWPMSLVYGGVAIGCFLMVYRQSQILWRDARSGFRREPDLPHDKND